MRGCEVTKCSAEILRSESQPRVVDLQRDKSRESAPVSSMCRRVDYRINRVQFYTRFLWRTQDPVVQQNKWLELSTLESVGIILCSFIYLMLFLFWCELSEHLWYILMLTLISALQKCVLHQFLVKKRRVTKKKKKSNRRSAGKLTASLKHTVHTLKATWRCIIILSCRCWWVRKEHYCKANEVSTPFKDKLLSSLISLVFRDAALLSVTVKPVSKGQKG